MKYKCTKCDAELKELEDGTMLHCDACGTKVDKKSAKLFREDGVTRLDIRDLAWESRTEAMKETPEGYLVGKVAATNIGVFSYTQLGGVVRRELRLPEEVFAPESLETLKLKPITRLHPKKRVTADNVKEFQVGSCGEQISSDPYRVYVPIVITDASAVKAARENLSAVSCGYDCDLEYTSGVHLGQQYDAIQRNIRYNHLALVPKGRAGDETTIRFDAADAICDEFTNQPLSDGHKPSKEDCMKTLHLDGVEYQAEAPVIAALHQATQKIEAMESKLTLDAAERSDAILALQVKLDEAQERADAAEAELKTRHDAAPEQVELLVKTRLALHDAARKAGVEFKLDAAESEIQTAVIQKAFPKADLTGKDPAYIQARFDSACEFLDIQSEQDASARMDASDIPNKNTKLTNEDSEESAFARSRDRLINAWKDSAQG